MAFINLSPLYFSRLMQIQKASFASNTLYWYVADSNSTEPLNKQNVLSVADEQDIIKKIIYGGKLTVDNFIPLIRKIKWTNGKQFDRYDPYDVNLENKSFYCITSANRIYKCLDNNRNSPSLYEPNFVSYNSFTLSDGYVWQYMYSLNDSQLNEFSVNGMIPVFENTTVKSNAVGGAITSVDVIDGGKYEFYHGEILHINAGNRVIRIDDSASSLVDIYNGMIVFNRSKGVLNKITKYQISSQGKFIGVEKNIESNWVIGDKISILPNIIVNGNGQISPVCITDMGKNGNIEKIRVLESGSGFTSAEAHIISSNLNMYSPASFKVNISPISGHGSDIFSELYCSTYMIHVNLDSYIIPFGFPINDVKFNKVGILVGGQKNASIGGGIYTDESFNNTFNVTIIPTNGSFQVGDKLKLVGDETYSSEVIYASSSNIIGTYLTDKIYNVSQVVENENGVSGMVLAVASQPQIDLRKIQILGIMKTGTIQRNSFSKEKIITLVSLRDK